MRKPVVSVIVPVYNAESTIGGVIEGVLLQSYTQIELILVDDGSTDRSLDLMNKFKAKDSRITVISQKNGGPSAARNAGLNKAGGEFVVFIDADDSFSKEITNVLVVAQAKNNTDFTMCGMDVNGNVTTAPSVVIDGKAELVRYILKSLLKNNLIYGPYCKLFKRDIIGKYNITFDESMRYGEDTVFVIEYLKNCESLANVNESLYSYSYRFDGLGHSGRNRLNDRKKRSRVAKLLLKQSCGPLNSTLFMLILMRWKASYIKAILGSRRA